MAISIKHNSLDEVYYFECYVCKKAAKGIVRYPTTICDGYIQYVQKICDKCHNNVLVEATKEQENLKKRYEEGK